MRICSINGCVRKHAARGLCIFHYEQLPDVSARKKAGFKRRYSNNPDIYRNRCKDWRSKNAAKFDECVKRWRNSDSPAALRKKIGDQLRTRLWHALNGGFRSGSAVRDLGCSIEELKRYLEEKFDVGMNWNNYGKWHIDHVRALVTFDLSDPLQLREAVHFTNLQPLWAIDNLRKGKKEMSHAQ